MKKMKYLFVFLVALCFMPNVVNATQSVFYKEYKVGDKITVTLDEDEKLKGEFIVIEATPKGTDENVTDDFDYEATEDYHTVTAIYVKTVGNSAFSKDTNSATLYKDSLAASNLLFNTRDLGWINYETGGLRLLTRADIYAMINSLPQEAKDEIYGNNEDKVADEPKCTTDSSGNITCTGLSAEIKPAGPIVNWTAVKKYLPFLFIDSSYWLGEDSAYETYCPIGQTCAAVMRNWATGFGDSGVSTVLAANDLALRPVITIHKGFVEGGMICNCENCEEDEKVCPNDTKISIQACINGGETEEACIKKLCPGTEKTENPKTGSYLPLLGIVVAGVLASCVYVSTRNKTYFKKIK